MSSFKPFKEFKRRLEGTSLEDVIDYLNIELVNNFRDLRAGLVRRLSFADNFQSFSTTIEIASGAELSIRNELRDGRVPVTPTEWITVRKFTDDAALVVDGDTEWTAQRLYLKNPGAGTAKLTVRFFR